MYKLIVANVAQSELEDKIWAGSANSWQTSPNFFLQFIFSCNSLVHDPAPNIKIMLIFFQVVMDFMFMNLVIFLINVTIVAGISIQLMKIMEDQIRPTDILAILATLKLIRLALPKFWLKYPVTHHCLAPILWLIVPWSFMLTKILLIQQRHLAMLDQD